MTATMQHSDVRQVRHLAVGELRANSPIPSARPTTVLEGGAVVPMRRSGAIALGSLGERDVVVGERLVSANDRDGRPSWIAAAAVWSDAEDQRHPQRPRPIGLVTANGRSRALVNGLSDRLGWEALLAFERGCELPPVDELADVVSDRLIVLDGRLGHDVPTVVVLGPDTVRWGAATTWEGAFGRALYGDDWGVESDAELTALSATLAGSQLAVVAVDLGTPLLERASIVRCSVQLVVVGDASGRSWDAAGVN